MKYQREPDYTICPFLVIVVETREWSLFLLSNDWIDLNGKKPGFFSYLFKCFPMLLPAFTIASYRWAFYYTYQYLFFVRAHDWSKRSILSAEEGKSFMLKTYSIKVCLLLLSCQHHSYMKQGAKIMILYNLEIPSFCKYTDGSWLNTRFICLN